MPSSTSQQPPPPAPPAAAGGGSPAPGLSPARRAGGAPARAFRSFTAGSMPAMSRRNYALELRAAFFLPFLLAVVDSTIIAVVVKNVYETIVPPKTLNFIVAILSASVAAANVVSFAWVRLSHGRDKIRFINTLQIVMIASVGVVGFVPLSGPGLWTLVAAVLAARFCWAGFITVRSTIWRQNYSRSVRARVTGKLATVQVLTLAGLGFGLGLVMDRHPMAFRIFFPVGCVLSAVGVLAWSRIRVRGHRSLLAAEKAGAGEDAPSFNPVGVLRLLLEDRLFGRFMLCMFTLGLGNIMIQAPLIIVLKDQFDLKYLGGIALANSIPFLMMPVSIPLWARLLDRVHVIRFRAIHSWFFVAAAAIVFLAVRFDLVWLLYASAVIQGLAFGGGALAWNLGHLDFAPPHRASQYMGVHVTLTGVRGLIAPFLGVWLYEAFRVDARATEAGNGGEWVFLACLGCCFAGAAGFALLARSLPPSRGGRTEPVETAPPSRVGV